MGAHDVDQALDLEQPSHLLSLDTGLDTTPQPLVADVLQPRLEARDVFLDLLDEGEVIAESLEPASGVIRFRLPRTCVQAAISTASMRSVFARFRCSMPKAFTCTGCSRVTTTP
jgi:hypothetical protein